MPPSAIAAYADRRSIGCTSSVPIDIEVTGTVPLGKVSPKSFIRWNRWSRPLIRPALMDGMLSENWRAERRRTGPRSSLSACVGMNAFWPPKFVVTSMNIVAAVIEPSSMPVM